MAMEIGGDIEIPLSHLWWPKLGQHKDFIPEGWSYLPMSNGRAALRLVLREILKLGQGDEVLMPAYVFDGLLNPFRESGMTIKFYKVSDNLTLDAEDIKQKMSQKTKVLFERGIGGEWTKADLEAAVREELEAARRE